MRAERAVFDTNILISAVLTRGKPFHVFRRVLDNGVLTFSDPTFEELATRAKKPKFDRYVSQDGDLPALDPFEHIRIVTAAEFLDAVSSLLFHQSLSLLC